MTNSTGMNTQDRELVVTRILNAPRELVFKVWTDPEHIVHWWGPNGFTNTIEKMNVKEGGEWIFTMHGPDGTDYPNRIVYHEIREPELLVYTHGSDDPDDPRQFNVRVTMKDLDGKTSLRMHLVLRSAEDLEEAKKHGAVEGGMQTMDKLEAYLKKF